MRLLVYDIQGKIFVKARHFKLENSAVSFTNTNTHSPETAKFSVVAQRLEPVKAYDCYKRLIVMRKVQVLFIDKT